MIDILAIRARIHEHRYTPYAESRLGVRARDACCALGGGHEGGANLIMDKTSPIMCHIQLSGHVHCQCSNNATQRYQHGTCIDWCPSGQRWEDATSSQYNNIVSRVGQCVHCLAGRYSAVLDGEWVETCSKCASGSYSSNNGASKCQMCAPGTYTGFGEGKTVCNICTFERITCHSLTPLVTYISSQNEGHSRASNTNSRHSNTGTPGTYSEFLKGSSMCLNCSAGWYNMFNGSSKCTRCGPGTYVEFERSVRARSARISFTHIGH
ncbi:hypothetical protein OAV88_00885 [bacterium]|nr:hypothetical protein [bacterium]